jgi:hypothetical protein
MFIRTLSLSNISRYQKCEERYARHLARVKRRFDPRFYYWIKDDRLHDAVITGLDLDDENAAISLEFHYVGEWIKSLNGRKPKRPQTRRLVLDFANVSMFSINATKSRSISCLGAEFIVAELNTHPAIRGRRMRNSLTICLGGKTEFELEIVFSEASFRELRAKPNTSGLDS